VRLLLDYYYNIACLLTRELVRLSMERVLTVVWGAFVDLNIKNLFLLNNFLAIAVLALILLINHLALTLAIIARALALSVHAWAKLLHSHYLPTPTTSTANLNCAFFSAFTSTGLADPLSVDCNLCFLTHVYFFECHLQWVCHWLALLRSLLPRPPHLLHLDKIGELKPLLRAFHL